MLCYDVLKLCESKYEYNKKTTPGVHQLHRTTLLARKSESETLLQERIFNNCRVALSILSHKMKRILQWGSK